MKLQIKQLVKEWNYTKRRGLKMWNDQIKEGVSNKKEAFQIYIWNKLNNEDWTGSLWWDFMFLWWWVWRWLASRMLLCVVWSLLTNIWQEFIASIRSRDSSVSIMSGYGLDERACPLASVSRLALGPTQPAVQWVLGVLSPGVKRSRGMTLTIHPHLLQRSWMSRSCTSSPPKRLHGV
jgi:hypothetical protein